MSDNQLIIIMKNPGTACNMGCVYCAEERKRYVSVSDKIDFVQVKRLADITKDYSLNVLFHGGEPTLLPPEYYEKIMDIFNHSNSDVYFGVQTNAFKIDDKWIDFIKENKKRLGVSVSLDGTQSINRYRLNKEKSETFEHVFKNIKKMELNGIKTGMICTVVSTAIGKEKELVELLMEFNNLQFVKLNPCFDRDPNGKIPDWAVTPKQYSEFVKRFFKIMLNKDAWSKFYNEPILSILKNIQGVNASFCNYSLNKCFYFITLYPDGTITSCDNYALDQGFLGKLDAETDLDAILSMRNNSRLRKSYELLIDECSGCGYFDICRGGCIAARYRYSDTKEYCTAMKSMIDYIRKTYEAIHENS